MNGRATAHDFATPRLDAVHRRRHVQDERPVAAMLRAHIADTPLSRSPLRSPAMDNETRKIHRRNDAITVVLIAMVLAFCVAPLLR